MGPKPSVGGAVRPSEGDRAARRPRLLHGIVGYGAIRTVVEALLAGRGLLLAGVLAPELFGVWALFRIALRYLGFAALGSLRGLELEVSRAGRGSAVGADREPWGRATLGQIVLLYGALSAISAVGWAAFGERAVSALVLLGVTLGLLLDRLWAYGIAYLRAAGGLRRFAAMELLQAAFQVVACVGLAVSWGLTGAFVGYAAANLAGILLLGRRIPLRPDFDWRRVKRLIRVGFPVSAMGILAATLATVDRFLVGALVGLSGLGIYAFAVSISELGVSFANVVRTVILKDVYSEAEPERRTGSGSGVLDHAMLGFSTLAPPVLALFALLLPLLIDRVAEDYREAATAAQLLLFAGLIQGLINVSVLGVVARERQGRLPLLSIGALGVNVVLTWSALSLGLGLEGVAGAALLTRILHAAGVLVLLLPWAGAASTGMTILRLLVPAIWCALAVYAINRAFPANDLETLLVDLALLCAALVVLLPAIIRLFLPRSARAAA